MEEIANLLFNYGVGIACIGYFIYFNNTTLKELTSTLQNVCIQLERMNERISDIENSIKAKNKAKVKEVE